MKVLLLNNVPAPYFSPLFEKLGKAPGWRLTVCYTTNWNQTVGWQNKALADHNSYRTVILDQVNPTWRDRMGSSLSAAIALKRLLSCERPDYLICYGYTLKPQITLLNWAILNKTQFALIGDANYFFDQAYGLKRIVKNAWLRFVTKRASALITIGTANKLFWEKYGAIPSQLFGSCLAVDNDFFSTGAGIGEAANLRSRLKLDNKVIFLFVGRLVKRKNVNLIIQAARLLNTDNFGIVIVGSGEEREALKSLADGNPNISFAGNVSPDELPVFYSMADVLVLPANQEPWGLVINEAMNCGLAIIAHKHCGATMDLIDADNGITLQGFSVEELAKAMQLLINDRSLLCLMQERSKMKIRAWSIECAAEGIVHAVKATYQKK